MKRKDLQFPLEVLNEKLFYINHCIEKFNDDKYICTRLKKNAKELEYVIKLIELQIEVNKINN
jgi:hypothetical protein